MDGMHWMASAMHAAQAQLETATHNLANVASDGFRRVRTTLALTDRGLAIHSGTDPAQGGLRQTGRTLDLALIGPGTFRVGGAATRDGSFVLDRDGFIADLHGRRLHGVSGPFRVSDDVTIASDGVVRSNGRIAGRIPLPDGTTLRSGALESSGVDAIGETLSILTAQRAFETAQKTLAAIDQTRDKAVNDVVRLK
jgi:flagellar basal body rod protein FlgG